MPKKRTRPQVSKVRSGIHLPTKVIRTKNLYSRPEEKKTIRRHIHNPGMNS